MATLETWNGRTSGQTDADSPLDTTLMDGIRKDLDHLKQVLYGNNEGAGTYFTPIWGHNHDGVNSPGAAVADGAVTTAKLAASAVTGAKISKTIVSSGFQNMLSGTTWTPVAGIYNMTADNPAYTASAHFQMRVSGVWYTALDNAGYKYLGIMGGIFDGSNMRIKNDGPNNVYVYYQSF